LHSHFQSCRSKYAAYLVPALHYLKAKITEGLQIGITTPNYRAPMHHAPRFTNNAGNAVAFACGELWLAGLFDPEPRVMKVILA